VGKIACWSTKAAISLRTSNLGEEEAVGVGDMVPFERALVISYRPSIVTFPVSLQEKLLWRAYRKSPTLFRTVPYPRPLRRPLPQDWKFATPKTSIVLSPEWVKLRTLNMADTFIGSIRTKAHSKFWRKGSVGVSRACPNFLNAPCYLRNG